MKQPLSSAHYTLRLLAIAYLLLQGGGGLAWWLMLIFLPASRLAFMAAGAPECTLLAFAGADLLLYAGGSLVAGLGLWGRREWAWPVLCIHTGAAVYAALYCLGLWLLDGSAWLAAVMMAPSLVFPPLITWMLRPAGRST